MFYVELYKIEKYLSKDDNKFNKRWKVILYLNYLIK